MSAKKKTISLPEKLFAKAQARAKELDYPTFSDYIQALVRADAAEMHEDSGPAPPPPAPESNPVHYLRHKHKKKIRDGV